MLFLFLMIHNQREDFCLNDKHSDHASYWLDHCQKETTVPLTKDLPLLRYKPTKPLVILLQDQTKPQLNATGVDNTDCTRSDTDNTLGQSLQEPDSANKVKYKMRRLDDISLDQICVCQTPDNTTSF